MKTDTHAKDHNDGSINATTHQYHLSEVGTCGLYVVDSHGDKRKTGRIDENVNDINPAKRNVLDLQNETCKYREKRNVIKKSHTRHFKAI